MYYEKINQENQAENVNLNIKSKKEDTLVSASIEDGKRVDAAFAKYLEECNAKSSAFDFLDIKPKNLKPLD